MTETKKNQEALHIAERLIETVGKVRFGRASVDLKIHDGRIVANTYSVTENTKERAEVNA